MRVVWAFLFLVLAKLVLILVPYFFKFATDALNGKLDDFTRADLAAFGQAAALKRGRAAALIDATLGAARRGGRAATGLGAVGSGAATISLTGGWGVGGVCCAQRGGGRGGGGGVGGWWGGGGGVGGGGGGW